MLVEIEHYYKLGTTIDGREWDKTLSKAYVNPMDISTAYPELIQHNGINIYSVGFRIGHFYVDEPTFLKLKELANVQYLK